MGGAVEQLLGPEGLYQHHLQAWKLLSVSPPADFLPTSVSLVENNTTPSACFAFFWISRSRQVVFGKHQILSTCCQSLFLQAGSK